MFVPAGCQEPIGPCEQPTAQLSCTCSQTGHQGCSSYLMLSVPPMLLTMHLPYSDRVEHDPTAYVPHLLFIQGMIQNFVRSTLSLTFVIAAARVVFNIKARMTRETTWQLELKGDLTKQRRVEAVDKLLSVMTLLVSAVFGLQAIGLDGGHPQPCS